MHSSSKKITLPFFASALLIVASLACRGGNAAQTQVGQPTNPLQLTMTSEQTQLTTSPKPVSTPKSTPVSPTPAPQTANQETPVYQLLLGKSLRDSEVSDFILQNNCRLTGFHYLCKAIGIELSLNSGQKVITVFMYAQGVDDFDEYEGELPYGFTWNSTRADVQMKLGLPSAEGHEETTSWAGYRDIGVFIEYDSPSLEELSAKMHRIQVQER